MPMPHAQHQCLTSLMLLWMNELLSKQPHVTEGHHNCKTEIKNRPVISRKKCRMKKRDNNQVSTYFWPNVPSVICSLVTSPCFSMNHHLTSIIQSASTKCFVLSKRIMLMLLVLCFLNVRHIVQVKLNI